MKAGIQAIIQKIGAEAEEHSRDYFEKIKDDIDGQINGENIIYRDEQGKRREIFIKNNEHEYARMFERLGSRLNREILRYQRELADGIFDMAVSKLRDVSKAEFFNMFKAALKELTDDFPGGGSFILHLGEFSGGKLESSEIEEAAKETGRINIVLDPGFIPKKSGFVLSDERIEYNYLFEDLIEDKKNEQTAQILKEVFGDTEKRLIF